MTSRAMHGGVSFHAGQKWRNHNGVILLVMSIKNSFIKDRISAKCQIIHHPVPFMIDHHGTFTVEELLDEGYQVVNDMDLFHGKVC